MYACIEELRYSARDMYTHFIVLLGGKSTSVEMSTLGKNKAPSMAIKNHFVHTSRMQESRDVGKKY